MKLKNVFSIVFLLLFAQYAVSQRAELKSVQPVSRLAVKKTDQRSEKQEKTQSANPKKKSSKKKVKSQSLDSTKVSLVYLEHSETLSFDEVRLPDAQILKGNVCFRHDSALMYCDSAYFFQEENSLHAFGNVHLVQGDSVEGWGRVLYYNGNTKMARFRRNVRMTHQGMVLTTDSLNYDRKQNLAYYFSGGVIKDSLNTLTSRWGQYMPDENQALFRGEVLLVNPDFTLSADTLGYNTSSYQADLVGPTTIVYEEETTILSSAGWYNTESEQSMLLSRSQVIHADGKTLTGDTIYYDKQLGYGRVLGNMESVDSVNCVTLYGDRGEMWEDDSKAYVTDSALLLDWSDTAQYVYVHADTLYKEQVPYQYFILQERDSILMDSVLIPQSPDTIWRDTNYMQLRAFYKVRIYREDVQSVCDSVHYQGKDSIATLYGSPICWNASNQVSADSIKIYVKNGVVDYLYGSGNAIAIKQEGANEFNQLSGKEMYAYMRDGDVYLIDVRGNAETVFYPREDDGSYLGVNKTQSSFVKLYLQNRQVERVLFTTATSGVMIPLREATESERKLNAFFWAEAERPRQPGDVFLSPERTARPAAVAVSAAASADEEEEEEKTNRKNKANRNTSVTPEDNYQPMPAGMGTGNMNLKGGFKTDIKR